jgi:pilus assembly protein CpaE
MGATSIATNLAGSLHRQGRRTVLVDLDLEMGDVTSFLDLQGSYGIADVLSNIRRLDRNLLETSLPRHRSGVWVVSQSEKVEEADRVDPAGVTALLRFLRQHFDNVVVDGLRSFGDLPLAALDASDRVLLVVTQEVPAVRSAQRCAEIFRKLGYDGQRLTLVVNRYLRGSPITKEVVEETVGLPVGATIANDFQTLTRSINQGVLLGDVAPRAALAKDIDAIATTMAATVVRAGARASSGSFLKKIFSPRVIHGAQ